MMHSHFLLENRYVTVLATSLGISDCVVHFTFDKNMVQVQLNTKITGLFGTIASLTLYFVKPHPLPKFHHDPVFSR